MKFTVIGFESTASGNYARIKNEKMNPYGLITNLGWKKGDEVEMKDWDGEAPGEMKVNGKEVWNESHRQEYVKNAEAMRTQRVSDFKSQIKAINKK